MSAYALAHLRDITPHSVILEYLERIQATSRRDPSCRASR
jgi:hypothetical protein